jgi:hypothetical protein
VTIPKFINEGVGLGLGEGDGDGDGLGLGLGDGDGDGLGLGLGDGDGLGLGEGDGDGLGDGVTTGASTVGGALFLIGFCWKLIESLQADKNKIAAQRMIACSVIEPSDFKMRSP